MLLVSTCTLHRFQAAVNLATFDLSASLIGNTFTLASDANINTDENFRPDYRIGLLALLSRFSSSFLKSLWHTVFLQPRRCEHHGQQHGSAGEGSTWPPWLRGCRGAAGEGGALGVHPDWAVWCWCLGGWQHFCSALHRLNCDWSTLLLIFYIFTLSCAQQLNQVSFFRAAGDNMPLACFLPHRQLIPFMWQLPEVK